MAKLSLQRTHELTFQVESPILVDSGSTSLSTSQSNSDTSYWTISLTRSGESLSVKVDWHRCSSHYHQPEDNRVYAFMHILPHGNGEDIATTSISFQNPNGTSTVYGKLVFPMIVEYEPGRIEKKKKVTSFVLFCMGRKRIDPDLQGAL